MPSLWLCFPIRLFHQGHLHFLLVALLLDRLFSSARAAAALLAQQPLCWSELLQAATLCVRIAFSLQWHRRQHCQTSFIMSKFAIEFRHVRQIK